MATDRFGVDDGYHDAFGRWHAADPAVLECIRAELGEPAAAPIRVVRAGEPATFDGTAELRLEDGRVRAVTGSLPADLPVGYHELWRPGQADPLPLWVRPARCPPPPDGPSWGLAVQPLGVLAGARGGCGDLLALAGLVEAVRSAGGRWLLLAPLGAPKPTSHQEPSPYYASSRVFLSPLLLPLTTAPAETGPAAGELLDLDRVWRDKRAALEREWRERPCEPDFERWCREDGELKWSYGVFAALAERFDAGWPAWPAAYRRPSAPAVAAFAAAEAGRVRFHLWLQWRLDAGLAGLARSGMLVADLPVGFAGDGFDAWRWQDALARGMSLGAPPDGFAPRGQDWGLPPFVPARLLAGGLEAWRAAVRAGLAHAAGLRIDHVMGLFRQFWIPHGRDPVEGTYVRQPVEPLLAVLAIEAERAGAFVVGEDLGTVEPGVRERLAAEGILGYRLLWFDEADPADWPAGTIGAVTTHDLPTIAGLVGGHDVAELRRLGLDDVARAVAAMGEAARARLGFDPSRAIDETVVELHERLARAPSAILFATLEDVLLVESRPNLPGTTGDRRPNWRRVVLGSGDPGLGRRAVFGRIARALDRSGGGGA